MNNGNALTHNCNALTYNNLIYIEKSRGMHGRMQRPFNRAGRLRVVILILVLYAGFGRHVRLRRNRVISKFKIT